MTNATAKRRSVRPQSTSSRHSQVVPARRPQVSDIPDDIQAEVEAELARQRQELTAKLVAEREAEKARKEAERQAAIEAATKRAAAQSGTHPIDLAGLKLMLAQAGIALVPAPVSAEPEQVTHTEDYSKTEHVQLELLALCDMLGVVRTADVIAHVRREDGGVMSPSNVRYHMRKLANRGQVKKVEERYHVDGLGWRTRDVWSRDPQKLLEVLEGKKTVKS